MPGVDEAAGCGVVVKITLVSEARSNQVSRRSGACDGSVCAAPANRHGARPVSRRRAPSTAPGIRPASNGLLGGREGLRR